MKKFNCEQLENFLEKTKFPSFDMAEDSYVFSFSEGSSALNVLSAYIEIMLATYKGQFFEENIGACYPNYIANEISICLLAIKKYLKNNFDSEWFDNERFYNAVIRAMEDIKSDELGQEYWSDTPFQEDTLPKIWENDSIKPYIKWPTK